MDKKGFVDMDVVMSPAFVMLALFALTATTIGYIASSKMDLPAFPVWQLIVIMIGEVIAAYVFALRSM